MTDANKLTYIDIVLTRGPGHECDFVEVEDSNGHSFAIGEWVDLPNGLVALRIPDPRRIAELEAANATKAETIAHLEACNRRANDRISDLESECADWYQNASRQADVIQELKKHPKPSTQTET